MTKGCGFGSSNYNLHIRNSAKVLKKNRLLAEARSITCLGTSFCLCLVDR